MQPLFLFKLLDVPFFSYTTLAGFGILLAIISATATAKSSFAAGAVISASAWASGGALAGGRLLHVAYNYEYFSEHPSLLLGVLDGGFAFVGLFCGGCLGLWLWCRHHQVPFGVAAEYAALPVSVLAALGWLGAFFHGSQYGATVDNALALELRDTFGVIEARWPTQLLAAGWSALVGLTLIIRRCIVDKRVADGQKGDAALFLTTYGTALFILDFTRGDASLYVGGLRLTQILYLIWAIVVILNIGRTLRKA